MFVAFSSHCCDREIGELDGSVYLSMLHLNNLIVNDNVVFVTFMGLMVHAFLTKGLCQGSWDTVVNHLWRQWIKLRKGNIAVSGIGSHECVVV